MNSLIYSGSVWHKRLHPVGHNFRVPIILFSLDLSELEELGSTLHLFGYNHFSLFTLRDRAYINDKPIPLAEKFNLFLEENGFNGQVSRVMLITTPCYLGYVFNPVSFYCCSNSSGELCCVVCEVSNTFGETKLYLTLPDGSNRQDSEFEAVFAKTFYVSPFFPVSGSYTLKVSSLAERLALEVALSDGDQMVFQVGIEAKGVTLSDGAILKAMLSNPVRSWLTMPRIHWQALLLYKRCHLPFFAKPVYSSCPFSGKRARFFGPLRLKVMSRGRQAKP